MIRNITLRAVLDSSGRHVHDEITCDTMDQPEAKAFIEKYSKKFLVIPYNRRHAENARDEWIGFREKTITKIPQEKWIYQALVFGETYKEIDPSLTLELTPEQAEAIRLVSYSSRPAILKEVAGEELTNRYKMWFVFCERPKWEAGMADFKNFEFISGPPSEEKRQLVVAEDESDWLDGWKKEIAMEAGMMGGCDAYNEVMGY